MDELDSVAPKRGNQGDSGGVMDRIVSQLLAELDGMSKGDGGDVYVMGATNRPDLLDSALLRPGRFDRMVYLSPPQLREEQRSILSALTRKFNLHPDLDLSDVVGRCGFNLTGADFYALASDAMLCAMTRTAEKIDQRIAEFGDGDWPKPLTPQYYLDRMAKKEEMQVVVGFEDFAVALERLRPSVSDEEMRHYERVQGEFRGSTMNGH
jgi:peroxin-6